ncbi:MAG TPA: hypothetical protein VN812_06760 [Candidatus Acidoferrales bacterium]|nr:hypothetical protein [Candidatus Acidoferrales bacterium]
MSQYLRVLKRIEKDRDGAAPSSAPVRRVPAKADVTPQRLGSSAPQAVAHLAAAAFATLFDNLRTADNGQPIRHLVVAAAAPPDSAATVVDGLATHAQSLGLSVVVAETIHTAGRPLLRCRQSAALVSPLPLALHSGWQTGFPDWLASATGDADMMIIHGEPLTQTVDAALLSRGCDGLVIVADVLGTRRDDLRTAAERGRAVGARTLGIVLSTTRHHLPGWLQRLVGADRLPVASMEKYNGPQS